MSINDFDNSDNLPSVLNKNLQILTGYTFNIVEYKYTIYQWVWNIIRHVHNSACD